jgi:hypothetical protein
MTTVTQITPKQSEQPTTSATPDLASLKIRQQAAWSSGNYAIVGTGGKLDQGGASQLQLPLSFARAFFSMCSKLSMAQS